MVSLHSTHSTKYRCQKELGILFSKDNGGNELPHGDLTEVEEVIKVHLNSIEEIWRRHTNGDSVVRRQSVGLINRNQKKKELIRNKLNKIYVTKRGNISSLSHHLSISVGETHREIKNGDIRKVKTILNQG